MRAGCAWRSDYLKTHETAILWFILTQRLLVCCPYLLQEVMRGKYKK